MDDDIDEDYDIEIKCPYCNKNFTKTIDEITGKDVVCPECKNTIELDWGDESDCEEHNCDCCSHDCHHDEDEDM